MKTILVCYVNSLGKSKEDVSKLKKYPFNTNNDVKVGDVIRSQEYDAFLKVVRVLDKLYSYHNTTTGELSNEFTSTYQWEIRELEIREENSEVIYGKIVKLD